MLFLLLPAGGQTDKGIPSGLDTVAEKSNFNATSRHADVLAYCERLAKASPLVHQSEMGKTSNGRSIPLVIVADPPVRTPEEAARSGKLVVLLLGNIHAGEVDGKEALLMLARDIVTAKQRPLLKDLILVFAPNFNPDGGDKFGKHRPWQAGPPEVGTRVNGEGFDLNRDFIKLETSEVQAFARFCRRWDPALLIDTHTTNGSYHGYTITYDGPRHPAADPRLCAFVREQFLPEAGRRLASSTTYQAYFYANFDRAKTIWEPYPAQPRYSIQYLGLRNRIGILVESYVYAPYRDRVLASHAFVRSCLEVAAANRERIRQLLKNADAARVSPIAVQHKLTPLPERVKVTALEGGKTLTTAKTHDLEVNYLGLTEAVRTVDRPYAYLLPASYAGAVTNLQRHGIQINALREDVELDIEAYRVTRLDVARPFQKHSLLSLETTLRKESRRLPAGTILVRTAQPLGTLAAFLLEPGSEDGLATWNFFDAGLKEGRDFPVLRLPHSVPLLATPLRPLPEDRRPYKIITWEMYEQGRLPNLAGEPTYVQRWLPDGEYFLQLKEGRRRKVHALTGRSSPYEDRAAKAAKPESVRLASPFVTLDSQTSRQIGSPQSKTRELFLASPDNKSTAFVRGNNLFVEDQKSKKEIALTADGGELVLNGKADWVYWEELYHRRTYRAFWWSPDSKYLAFLRFDETGVPVATVVNYVGITQKLERTPYPRAGEPNPTVKLGIVPATGGPIRWVDLTGYEKEALLIPRVKWLPSSNAVYFFVQNRIQSWLDYCTVTPEGGRPRKLFRDSSKAWTEDMGPPQFLKDGSFLWLSERSGWKHLYHYDKDGKLLRPVTTGEWEVRGVERIDEKEGYVYFQGTRDSHTSVNAYRIKLDGTGLTRLTKGPGNHQVDLNPQGTLFVDYVTTGDSPTQVLLCRTDGTVVRMLDTNPVPARDEFQLGEYQRVQIPTPDGFLLEASVHKPAKFDPKKKYPVWFTTYGGPHAPTVSDRAFSRTGDEARANLGYIIFRCDPRSASGKGAVSTWTAYRQLGVQELKDIETAIRWLTAKPWVDPARVGMSGHSYGGYITAYVLTHSKLFAAGIAGSPVTDWRNYDSIYTERYMDTPQANLKGYDAGSVVKAAANVHGKLLLAHGVMDDNVHVQNTLQLAQALQQANKEFEMMLYPTARHGIFSRHFQRLEIEFMKRTLQPQP
jgi:dipeptidyl aminopeptidase/acylaminoacyl peptidase